MLLVHVHGNLSAFSHTDDVRGSAYPSLIVKALHSICIHILEKLNLIFKYFLSVASSFVQIN